MPKRLRADAPGRCQLACAAYLFQHPGARPVEADWGAVVEARDQPTGWLFVGATALPERWRSRAIEMFLVPLLPDELAAVLSGTSASTPPVVPAEERLCQLVAAGLSRTAIARSLSVSSRTLDRRLLALRRRFGAESFADLRAALARQGF